MNEIHISSYERNIYNSACVEFSDGGESFLQRLMLHILQLSFVFKIIINHVLTSDEKNKVLEFLLINS